MADDLRALQHFADVVAEKIVDHKRAEELRRMVVDHQAWLQTGGEDGRKADLRGFTLERLNLSNLDLHGADLRGARIDGSSLKRVDLQGANLTAVRGCEAWMGRADLSNVDLGAVDFSGGDARMEGAKLPRAVELPERGRTLPGLER